MGNACDNKIFLPDHPDVAIGYNPKISISTSFNKRLFLSQLDSTKYIGAVGLDFSAKNITSKATQTEVFDFICHNAAKYNKVLSVHSRNAEKDTLEILTRNKVRRAIIHWYTGDLETLKLYVQAGYYFSVNANMCATSKGQSIIKHIPIDKLLVESDGPFTKVGSRRYTPTDLTQIYYCLSNLLEIYDLENVVFNNFNRLLTT